jgi:hypothetical protein
MELIGELGAIPPLVRSAGFGALNLSCEIKEAQVFNEAGVVSENGK